jgi:hypothetical protein
VIEELLWHVSCRQWWVVQNLKNTRTLSRRQAEASPVEAEWSHFVEKREQGVVFIGRRQGRAVFIGRRQGRAVEDLREKVVESQSL